MKGTIDMAFEKPTGRELPLVTEDVAKIRRWIDDHDIQGHANRTPDYGVIAQTSTPFEARSEREEAPMVLNTVGPQVVARLVAYQI